MLTDIKSTVFSKPRMRKQFQIEKTIENDNIANLIFVDFDNSLRT